ncbi:MAG TPA: tRNA 2-selenouridine(34) synthase MnmH [Bacillota bacterium]|nr:tRNA 2-selenouridine(34) synthase MnmH [Bacillota bacterium]
MFQDITLEDLLEARKSGEHTVIDVRSPKEYEEATIPGSINIPVFTNAERAEVGTLYRQKGQDAAKARGLELFSAKLPHFIQDFKNIQTPKTVFCWRGGMRSKTAATVLDLMGIHANRLTGGIRTYRKWVVDFLEHTTFSPELIVLNGFTGTGKTKLLEKLKVEGYPVIDLEGLANHRGSIFGQIGKKPSNQKRFDALLTEDIIRYRDEAFVFVEGESKRIGRAVMPDFLYQKKEQGIHIYVELPIEERIRNILVDYHPEEYPEQIDEAFQIIKKRIHTPVAKQIEESLHKREYVTAVQLLLQYYYDPRYKHSISQEQQLTIQANDVDDAFNKLKALYPLNRNNRGIS